MATPESDSLPRSEVVGLMIDACVALETLLIKDKALTDKRCDPKEVHARVLAWIDKHVMLDDAPPEGE